MEIIIGSSKILKFLEAHSAAQTAFELWAKLLSQEDMSPYNFNQLSSALSGVYSRLEENGHLTAFGILCGSYWIITYVNYSRQCIYVHEVCEQTVYDQEKK
ncbi:MAG: hypothetical protein AAFZ17_09295 [Cyanobacteria bacterium J06650_10]